MKAKLPRYLPWLGRSLSILGLCFLLFRFSDHMGDIRLTELEPTTLGLLASLSVISGLANILLALAWVSILRGLGEVATTSWSLHVYGTSQMARYIPGNVFHLASRQAGGIAAGLNNRALIISAMLEFGLISLAACMTSLLALPLISSLTSLHSQIFFAAGISITAALLKLAFRPGVASSFCAYVIYMLVVGSSYYLITRNVGLVPNAPWGYIVGAFALSWLVGFIFPGAPAGIGIREAILLVLLSKVAPEGELIVAIILARLINVAGDVLFFLLALAISRRDTRSSGS